MQGFEDMVASSSHPPKSLPRNVGPRAKRSILATPAETVQCVVEVAPAVGRADFEQSISTRGATVLTWDGAGRIATIEAPANRLSEIAEIREVVYLDAAEPYSL